MARPKLVVGSIGQIYIPPWLFFDEGDDDVVGGQETHLRSFLFTIIWKEQNGYISAYQVKAWMFELSSAHQGALHLPTDVNSRACSSSFPHKHRAQSLGSLSSALAANRIHALFKAIFPP